MFSKACMYGIRAVFYLAVHRKAERNIGVDEIAEELEIPRHFLAKILQSLTKADLISSVKGPHGGFFMSEENLGKNLLDVVHTIDGSSVFDSCVLGLKTCSSANPCPLHNHAFVYREGLMHQFKYLTIRDVSDRILLNDMKL